MSVIEIPELLEHFSPEPDSGLLTLVQRKPRNALSAEESEPMADPKHRDLARSGRAKLALWRADHPQEKLDLSSDFYVQLDFSAIDLSKANCSRANFRGANFRGADLRGTDFSRANLSEADLSNANLLRANLTGAELTHATLTAATLSGANCDCADFAGAYLPRIQALKASFPAVDFEGATCEQANFQEANLQGTSFYQAKCGEAWFHAAELEEATFHDTHLFQAKFNNSSLKAARFSHSDLCEADFQGASLERTLFRETRLAGTNFSQARLDRTHFYAVDLSSSRGLLAASIFGPCSLDLRTLQLSRGNLSLPFLLRVGLERWEAEFARLYDKQLSLHEVREIVRNLERLRLQLPQYLTELPETVCDTEHF